MVNELFVCCACGADGMNIVLDDDTGDVFFSLWYHSKYELTWRNKLRWIWNVIKGRPFPDEIVITHGWLPLIIDKLESMRIETERKHGRT